MGRHCKDNLDIDLRMVVLASVAWAKLGSSPSPRALVPGVVSLLMGCVKFCWMVTRNLEIAARIVYLL